MRKSIAITFALAACCTLCVPALVSKIAVAEKKLYRIEAESLVENYASEGLYQSAKTGNGYVAKWANTLVSPGATGALSITFTAPCDATVKPVNGNSLAAYRTNKVEESHQDDGVRLSVFQNEEKIYPAGEELFATLSDDSANITKAVLPELTLQAGDKLRFIIDCGGEGNNAWDSVYLNAEGMYTDSTVTSEQYVSFTQGLTYANAEEASGASGLGEYTKGELIAYEYVNVLEYTQMETVPENPTQVAVIGEELSWSSINDTPFWCGAKTDVYLYYDHSVLGDFMVPGNFSAIALAFTAPCDGTISNELGLGAVLRTGKVSDETDGARISVVKENQVLFPSEGIWAEIPQGEEEPMDIRFNGLEMKAGETLYYIVDCGGNANNNYDNVRFDNWGFVWTDANNPDGVWFGMADNYYTGDTGETESAIAGVQKNAVIKYLYASVENPIPQASELQTEKVTPFDEKLFNEMQINPTGEKYYIKGDRYLLVNALYAQPSTKYMLGIEWTAPDDGRVNISNSYLINENFNENVTTSNGVRFKLLLNDENQIPLSDGEWTHTKGTEKITLQTDTFAVKKGDTLLFVIDCDGEVDYDTLNMMLVYDFAKEGEVFTARYNNRTSLFEEDMPFTYYGIEIPLDEGNRYFGGNQTELEEVEIALGGGIGCNATLVDASGALVALTLVGAGLLTVKRKEE